MSSSMRAMAPRSAVQEVNGDYVSSVGERRHLGSVAVRETATISAVQENAIT